MTGTDRKLQELMLQMEEQCNALGRKVLVVEAPERDAFGNDPVMSPATLEKLAAVIGPRYAIIDRQRWEETWVDRLTHLFRYFEDHGCDCEAHPDELPEEEWCDGCKAEAELARIRKLELPSLASFDCHACGGKWRQPMNQLLKGDAILCPHCKTVWMAFPEARDA